MLNWKAYKHVVEKYKTYDEFGMELDSQKMWEEFAELYGAYPDGLGNICFDTEEGETFFIMANSRIENDNS